jgi:hypothetical protein
LITPHYERSCARRVILSYALPVEVDEALLGALFPRAQVRVQRLSAVVESARDLGRVDTADLEASAALGGARLIVAFNRAPDGALPVEKIEALTGALNVLIGVP